MEQQGFCIIYLRNFSSFYIFYVDIKMHLSVLINLSINSNNDSAWNNWGLALNNLDRYQEAMECFAKAIYINPKKKKLQYSSDIKVLAQYDFLSLLFFSKLKIFSQSILFLDQKLKLKLAQKKIIIIFILIFYNNYQV
ncbi:unnamed protein product [Paramecium octaurelia]|uniref:Tetratricopeptide repeat protein n=1 Tax=Paramecium octaurelia TaxID=43137 RepID=A0A8S1X550_PAROT|nr:unnamed protein product [Paramecium octaurelia]